MSLQQKQRQQCCRNSKKACSRPPQVWQAPAPPLDSGDEATYMLGPAKHPEDPHRGEAGDTSHAEAGEVWHKPHEVGGGWLPGVSVAAPGQAASWEGSLYFVCGGLAVLKVLLCVVYSFVGELRQDSLPCRGGTSLCL